jgi:hypothetical protein
LKLALLARAVRLQLRKQFGGDGPGVESAGNGSSLLPYPVPSPDAVISATTMNPPVLFSAMEPVHS